MSRAAMKHVMAAMTVCALAACAGAPTVEDRFYRPAVAVPTAPHAPLKVRFTVEPFEIHGLYSDRPLVYIDRSGAYQQSNHNNWIEPPSIMLASSLLNTLRAAYGKDAAFLPDARVGTEITVRTRIRRFERLPHAEPVQALLSLEIVVTGRRSKLIGSVDFEEAAPAGKTIPDYVQTQAVLFAKAYAKLLDLLDQHADELSALS